jgi:predicted metal-dependent peptidase
VKASHSVEHKLSRARTQLLLSQPFFGSLCLRLKLESGPVPTMATNGRIILYNPAFVESLKPAELEAVLAHEVMHVALAHHCRRGARERETWNEAADFAINPILLGNGFTLPAGALVDPAFADLSAEEIYSRLLPRKCNGANAPEQSTQPENSSGASGPQQAPGSPSYAQPSNCGGGQPDPQASQTDAQGKGEGAPSSVSRPGGFGEVLDAVHDDGSPASPAETSRQEHEWAIAAEQAVRAAKMCGHEPANVVRSLSKSRESKQDWRAILRDFVATTAPSDYRWTPPNRRYVGSGLYLPSVERSGVGRVVIAVDTSGSIGTLELEQFAGEISAIVEEAKPEAVHVVYCDAAVQASQEFGPSEPIDLKPQGGGGTDFCPVFEWVEENGIAPVCLIYLTDLCCHSYPPVPQYPVLWVTDSRRTAPFGETVRISLDSFLHIPSLQRS